MAGRYNNLNINYWTLANPIYDSTLQYFDGSFMKLCNINFGYNFPAATVSKLKISGLRVYTSIQQPFIFAPYRSKYKGVDPETADVINADQTPAVRQFTFGVNARF